MPYDRRSGSWAFKVEDCSPTLREFLIYGVLIAIHPSPASIIHPPKP